MGRTKGAPRNSSTVVFQHKFPFPEGRGLVGKVFFFPEIIQGLEIHEEQGWDAKPVAVSALGSREKLEKQLGKQERGSAGAAGAKDRGFRRNLCFHYSTMLAVGTSQDREGRSFLPKFPKKDKTLPAQPTWGRGICCL